MEPRNIHGYRRKDTNPQDEHVDLYLTAAFERAIAERGTTFLSAEKIEADRKDDEALLQSYLDQQNASKECDNERPPVHYEEIYRIFPNNKVISIERKAKCLIISLRGKCPIHGYEHSHNHWYILWNYYDATGDYFSCHHGKEKENREWLLQRMDLLHLQ